MCSAAVIGIYMTRHQNDQVSLIEEAVLLIPYSSNSSRFSPQKNKQTKKAQQHKHHHQTKQAKNQTKTTTTTRNKKSNKNHTVA